MGRLTLTPPLGVIHCEYPDKLYSPETTWIVLPDAYKMLSYRRETALQRAL